MTCNSTIAINGSYARVDALRAEFGGIWAERILEAEALDFIWEARVRERYLGQHVDEGDVERASQELSRILVLSDVAGRWQVAMCLADGEGIAVELLWKRMFATLEEADGAFCRAH